MTSYALSALGSLAANIFGELVGPSCCAACDVRVPATHLFCPACAATVERADGEATSSTTCIAAFEYGGAMAAAIARLKYEDRADLAPRLGRSMHVAARRLVGKVDVVIPVPLHPRRLADRGYNQAALLARPVARFVGAKLAPQALERQRDTPQQALLDRDARARNIHSAFRARQAELARHARVLLVDDVRTTGATLDACRFALREVGAKQVCALVLAQRP